MTTIAKTYKPTAKEKAYGKALDAIHARIKAKIGRTPVVFYSAYKTVDGIPVDNLDEIAVKGEVRFVAKHDPFWGGDKGKDFISATVENPTWLEVVAIADKMIRVTCDYHHCFLEAVERVRTIGSVRTAELFLGS